MINFGLGARTAVRAQAWDDLGTHGVRDHILDYNACDAQELGQHIEGLEAKLRDPTAGGSGEEDEASSNQTSTHEDVGAALRAEQRDRIHELTENHFHGPGQGEPNAEGGELSGRHAEGLLDPEGFGDAR